MDIFTMGYTHKTAKDFFTLLIKNKVEIIVDIRLNNTSQLAGFSKKKDLEFLAKAIGKISYVHYAPFAPTKDLLKKYKNKKLTWEEYEIEFNEMLVKRNSIADFLKEVSDFNRICLLCSEEKADQCHRRLVAEYIKHSLKDSKIEHI
jgi:uncharacterized protein (DUF488 family)